MPKVEEDVTADDEIVDLGAASELTQAGGNFSIEFNHDPRIWM